MDPKPKKPKFKYTRELVKIASADGMSQKEIGDLCRVEQSVVSGWINGKSLAYEHQIAELKKRYGSRLNRTTSRVYLVVPEESSDARWEDTERARRLVQVGESLKKEQGQHRAADGRTGLGRGKVKRSPAEQEWRELQEVILPGVPHVQSFETLSQIDREEFEAARCPVQMTQVEGPIVLRYTFVRHVPVMHRSIELTRFPIARWLVHRQPAGKFVLVHQTRRVLFGRALWRWREVLAAADKEANSRFSSGIQRVNTHFQGLADQEPYVECTDDAARWHCFLQGPMDAAGLLGFCDRYFQGRDLPHSPHDEQTLPFLVRKMLIEHGHEVPGVVRIVASE